MKTAYRILIVLLSSPALFCQADELNIPHVSVYGTAVLDVVPNEMHWVLAIETKGAEVAQVASAHDKNVDKLLSFLKKNRIEEKKTQTSQIQLRENWEYRGNSRIKVGYIASTTVTFETDKIDRYRDLWLGVSKLDNIRVNHIKFDHSGRIGYQNESRLKAIRAAEQKAIALSKALNSKIAEPLLIEEIMTGGTDYKRNRNIASFAESAMAGDSDGQSISPGTIAIRTQVKVKFRITAN